MTALALLQQLHGRGVFLTPYLDGTLRYKALQGTLIPALLDGMRQHKPELHALVADGEVSDASRQSRGNGMTHKEP